MLPFSQPSGLGPNGFGGLAAARRRSSSQSAASAAREVQETRFVLDLFGQRVEIDCHVLPSWKWVSGYDGARSERGQAGCSDHSADRRWHGSQPG